MQFHPARENIHTSPKTSRLCLLASLSWQRKKMSWQGNQTKRLKEVEDRLNFTKREQDATRQALEIEIN